MRTRRSHRNQLILWKALGGKLTVVTARRRPRKAPGPTAIPAQALPPVSEDAGCACLRGGYCDIAHERTTCPCGRCNPPGCPGGDGQCTCVRPRGGRRS